MAPQTTDLPLEALAERPMVSVRPPLPLEDWSISFSTSRSSSAEEPELEYEECVRWWLDEDNGGDEPRQVWRWVVVVVVVVVVFRWLLCAWCTATRVPPKSKSTKSNLKLIMVVLNTSVWWWGPCGEGKLCQWSDSTRLDRKRNSLLWPSANRWPAIPFESERFLSKRKGEKRKLVAVVFTQSVRRRASSSAVKAINIMCSNKALDSLG